MKPRLAIAALAGGLLLLSACGSDSDDTTATQAVETGAATDGARTEVAGTDAITAPTDAPTTEAQASEAPVGATDAAPPSAMSAQEAAQRCETNKAAGKIIYASSFDFAAAASIIDVVVADNKGYFKDLCLDVELKPGFSSSNYPLVASNKVQFSAAGGYTEIINYSKDGAKFVALADYGKTPIEALVTKDPQLASLADLKGKTIGVKGDIPPSIVAMLNAAGLTRGKDYKEVLLDGFDPKVHIGLPIDAMPVYKSNEPAQLDAAGIAYKLFDPTKENIPGSFGILYTSADYAAKNPTVVEDFIRASLRGMEDAAADPKAAVAISVAKINAAGNQAFLSEAGEANRWSVELAEVGVGLGGKPIGTIIPEVFAAEVAAYTKAGILTVPDPLAYDATLVSKLYGPDGKVIFTKYAA